MNRSAEVMMWAQRVLARKGQPPHVLLEVSADCTPDDAQAAFHKIARTAHPDLHRQGLKPDELETLTSAYAAVAGAYQELRTRTMATTRMKPLERPSSAAPPAATPSPKAPPAAKAPAPAAPATRTPSQPLPVAKPPSQPLPVAPAAPRAAPPDGAMSQRAATYYKKAEMALGRGDLKGAILQLKLACATDPASQFLRSALAEVETEVRKAT